VPQPEGRGSLGLKALGETIKSLRNDRDIGPRGLAFDAEISEATLTAVEKGESEPRWGTLRRIARGLDVDVSALLSDAEELEDRMKGNRK
jgi:transcriptional regulator with XRE-family HTH domain